MKNFLLICGLIFCLFSSCTKDKTASTEDLYKNSPATAVPFPLTDGIWFWGGSGPISYYDRDGHEVGSETEAAREYDFSEVEGKGRLTFWQYLGTRTGSNCVTEIYTKKMGTIAFSGTNKFTFYPVEGKFTTKRSGCSQGNSERPATAEDLQPETYLWEVKDFDGQKYFYVYNETDTQMQNAVFVYQQVK